MSVPGVPITSHEEKMLVFGKVFTFPNFSHPYVQAPMHMYSTGSTSWKTFTDKVFSRVGQGAIYKRMKCATKPSNIVFDKQLRTRATANLKLRQK